MTTSVIGPVSSPVMMPFPFSYSVPVRSSSLSVVVPIPVLLPFFSSDSFVVMSSSVSPVVPDHVLNLLYVL